MPEFQLSGAHAPTFKSLSYFAQGYIEALFFTNEGNEDGELGSAGFCDMAPETVARIVADCEAFQRACGPLLEEAYERDYAEIQAGRDFWFTRCGHGVGYWDRTQLDAGGLGEKLSDAAREFGNVDPYLGDDGLVYVL